MCYIQRKNIIFVNLSIFQIIKCTKTYFIFIHCNMFEISEFIFINVVYITMGHLLRNLQHIIWIPIIPKISYYKPITFTWISMFIYAGTITVK